MAWVVKQLGDLVSFERGLTYSKGDEVEMSSQGVLRSNNIDLETNTLNLDEIKYIKEDFLIPASKRIARNSLLMCVSNGSKSHLGKVALIEEDLDYAFGGFMGLLKPNEDTILPKYLYYSLISPAYKRYILGLSDGANINNLKYKDLAVFPVAFPTSILEQQRIVDILDAEFAKIDVLKENAAKNLQNAKDLFQATLETTIAKDASEELSLADICEITSALVNPQLEQYQDLYHIGGANIESNTGVLLDLKTAREEGLISGKFTFDDTMVLYSKIRPYLKKVARPSFIGLCSADIYPLKPKDVCNRDYLFYLLLSKNFTEYAIEGSARAGMPKVNRPHLFAYRCSIPPLEKQKQAAALLDGLMEKCNRLQDNYIKTISLCNDLKQALLRKAFNGEL